VHIFGARVLAALGWGPETVVYQVKVGIKEGAELGGWLLLLIALGGLLRDRAGEGLDLRPVTSGKLTRWVIATSGRRGYGRSHVGVNWPVPSRRWGSERLARRSSRRRRQG
jgi:hypothetical protein